MFFKYMWAFGPHFSKGMPPQTRRLAAIRKNIDYVARSTYQPGTKLFQTAQEIAAYIRTGQRLCIDAIPTEPVTHVRIRRRPQTNVWLVYAQTPQRMVRLTLQKSFIAPFEFYVASPQINVGMWTDRIDRRIEWRRQDIAMETLALAMHPRVGRNSPVYRATKHPLFDKNIFCVLLNQALGRMPSQRNRME